MSATSAVLAGRRVAERLMVDACTITPPGTVTTDDLTGAVTASPAAKYAGKCKIQQMGSGMGRRHDAGETSVIVLRLEIHLPVSTSQAVVRGDLITVTACVNDAALVGRKFRVHDEAAKSFATARRLVVEEVT